MSSLNMLTIVVASLFTCVLSDYAINPPYQLMSFKAATYILPIISFEYDALEPHMDEATLIAHHLGHHDAYKKKMNKALAEWRAEEPDNELAKDSILNILRNLVRAPEKYMMPLKNNGGGFVNHGLYWGCISPNNQSQERFPEGQMLKDIEAKWGSFESFKESFTERAMTLFGSGYVWLSRVPGKDGPNLGITTSANQDSPILAGFNPVLVIDVWEHAYYLKHQYKRADYVKDWWMLVDWKNVEELDQWWKAIDAKAAKKDEL